MNKINQNKLVEIGLRALKADIKGAKNMDEQVKNMVDNLLKRAEREVPEYGDFKVVFEELKNIDKDMVATDFRLRITKPTNNVEGHETKRFLELVAYNSPSPYPAETVIKYGTKEEIIKALKEEDLCEKLKAEMEKLSKNLEDI